MIRALGRSSDWHPRDEEEPVTCLQRRATSGERRQALAARARLLLYGALLAGGLCLPAALAAADPIAWVRHWDAALFAQAAREHRFVLLDLHAVWCHWCHVMDEKTYTDTNVRALITARYLPGR